MSTAVRVNSLSLSGLGPKSLPGMEAHGKREDQTSQARRVRDTPPLVHGSLDLRAAFDAHVSGARMNKALRKPVLHAIVQYPTEIELTAEREQWMLDEAVAFVNATYGGRAVFAARLDRDEAGRHTVDVFFSPRYEKTTRRGSQDWISTTKHGKELCRQHCAEIERRHDGTFRDGPRQVGIALQSEWRAHLIAAARDASLDLDLEPRQEKEARPPDRLEPEQFKDVQDARRRASEIDQQARRRGQAYAAAVDGIRAGRLVPSPRPGEWRRRDPASQGLLSALVDRRLDARRWSTDEWAELCRLSEANARARAEAENVLEAARLEAEEARTLATIDAERVREAAQTDADAAIRETEQRHAASIQAINKARAAAAEQGRVLGTMARDVVEEAEQRRDAALAEAETVTRAAEARSAALADATACAFEVIADELARPQPESGQWWQGARWDPERWRQVGQRLDIEWPARLWTQLRGLADRVTALTKATAELEDSRAQLRRQAERVQGWIGDIASRLGLATVDPAEVEATLAELGEEKDHLPQPTPFDDGP